MLVLDSICFKHSSNGSPLKLIETLLSSNFFENTGDAIIKALKKQLQIAKMNEDLIIKRNDLLKF